MAKRGENIYLRKDGRYEGRYIKGRTQSGKALFGYIYAKRYAEVKQKLTEVKAGIYIPSPAYKKSTVGEWMQYWLEFVSRPYITETTYMTYESQMRTHIMPALGGIALCLLDKDLVQNFVNGLTERLSAGMIHNILRLLKSAMRSAHSKGMIKYNPCEGIRRPVNKVKKPRVLTIVEQKCLEQRIIQEGKLEYLLCLYTGLRVGEVCSLRWEDFDFASNMLRIRRTAKRIRNIKSGSKTVVITGRPKTEDSIREIPVPAFLMDRLKQIKKESGWMFVADVRTTQQRLSKMATDLGIKGVHMHTLRHTFATRCLEAGIGVETLSVLMGHRSPTITLCYYAHCTKENKIRSVKKLKQIA